MVREQVIRFAEDEFMQLFNNFVGKEYVSDDDGSDGLMMAASELSEWVDVEKPIPLEEKSQEHLRIEKLIAEMTAEKLGAKLVRIISDHAGFVYLVVE